MATEIRVRLSFPLLVLPLLPDCSKCLAGIVIYPGNKTKNRDRSENLAKNRNNRTKIPAYQQHENHNGPNCDNSKQSRKFKHQVNAEENLVPIAYFSKHS